VDRRGWHVGKEIPIALVGVLLAQTIAVIWWIAGLSNKVDNLVITVNELKLERYSKDDARRDQDLLKLIVEGQRQRDSEQDRRINNAEVLLNQFMRSIK
jgi:hypothetical protein